MHQKCTIWIFQESCEWHIIEHITERKLLPENDSNPMVFLCVNSVQQCIIGVEECIRSVLHKKLYYFFRNLVNDKNPMVVLWIISVEKCIWSASEVYYMNFSGVLWMGYYWTHSRAEVTSRKWPEPDGRSFIWASLTKKVNILQLHPDSTVYLPCFFDTSCLLAPGW